MAQTAILNIRVDLNDQQARAEAVRLARQINQTLNPQKIRLNIDGRAANRTLRRTRRGVTSLNKAVRVGAVALTGYASAIFIIAEALRAVGAAAVSAVQTFAEFDRVIRTISVVSGGTAEEIRSIEQQARQLGIATEFTASQVANLQLVLARGGFRADEIQDLSRAVLDLATVTGEDTTAAAGALTSIIRTFQLEARDAADVLDVLTAGFNSSRLQLEFFTTAFGFVGSVAAEAGLEIRDLTAILGFLADRGIRASTAGTALRQILIDLRNPSSKAAQALGFTTNNAEGFFIALQKLNEQGIASSDVFRKTAVPAINVLREELENGNLSLEDFRKLLEDVDGESQRAADTLRDSLSGELAAVKSAVEGVGLAFVETFETDLRKAVRSARDLLRSLANAISGSGGSIQARLNQLRADRTFTPGGLARIPFGFLADPLFGPGGSTANRAEAAALRAARDAGLSDIDVFNRELAARGIDLVAEYNEELDLTSTRVVEIATRLGQLEQAGFFLDDFGKEVISFSEATDLSASEVEDLIEDFVKAVKEGEEEITGEGDFLTALFGTDSLEQSVDAVKRNFNLVIADLYRFFRETIRQQEDQGDPTTDLPGGAGGSGSGRTPRARIPGAPSLGLPPIDRSLVRAVQRDVLAFEKQRVTLLEQQAKLDPDNEEGIAAIDQALKLNQQALAVANAKLKAEEDLLKIEEEQRKILQAEARLNQLENLRATGVDAAGTPFSANQLQRIDELIAKQTEQLALLRENAKESTERIQQLDLEIKQEEAKLRLLELQKTEQEEINEQARGFVSALAFLDSGAPFSNTAAALGQLEQVFERIGDNADTFNEKLTAGFEVGRQAAIDFFDLALTGSQERIDAINEEFDARVEAAQGFSQVQRNLNKEREEALREEQERQARLRKAQAIFSITISGAQAIATTLGQSGFAGIFTAPIVAGLVAAQLATVIATPLPSFAKGGILGEGDGPAPGVVSGPSHAKGGVKGFFAGRGFEVEGGEALDYDEYGNLVVINKRSTAAFSRQLRAMRGRSFAGKSGILSRINAKYGNPFDQTTSFFQDGGVMRELSQIGGTPNFDNATIVKAIYEGSFNGTSQGIQVIDTNRRRERNRLDRRNGRVRESGRQIFGMSNNRPAVVGHGGAGTPPTSPT